MTRSALQDCPNGCGHKHYGPPTASNCSRYGQSAGVHTTAATSSSLASKSLLGATPTRQRQELDRDASMDDLLHVDMGAVEVADDGSIFESDDSPLEQGSVGDADEYIDLMSKGHNGWKAVAGKSNQHGSGADGVLMHESEVIGDGWGEQIKTNPGLYAAVSVEEDEYDEDGDLIDQNPVGWMLLKKETDTDKLAAQQQAEARSRGMRERMTGNDAYLRDEPDFYCGDSKGLRSAREALGRLPGLAGARDEKGILEAGDQAKKGIDSHLRKLSALRKKLDDTPEFREIREAMAEASSAQRGPHRMDRVRAAEETAKQRTGHTPLKIAAARTELTARKENIEELTGGYVERLQRERR